MNSIRTCLFEVINFVLETLPKHIPSADGVFHFLSSPPTLLVAGLSVVLTQLIVIYRGTKEKKKEIGALLLSMYLEMEASADGLDRNNDVLAIELRMLNQGSYYLKPLTPIYNDVIHLMLKNSPQTLVKHELLVDMTHILRLVNEFNSQSRVRESLWLSINIASLSDASRGTQGIMKSLKSFDENGLMLTSKFLSSLIEKTLPKVRKLVNENDLREVKQSLGETDENLIVIDF